MRCAVTKLALAAVLRGNRRRTRRPVHSSRRPFCVPTYLCRRDSSSLRELCGRTFDIKLSLSATLTQKFGHEDSHSVGRCQPIALASYPARPAHHRLIQLRPKDPLPPGFSVWARPVIKISDRWPAVDTEATWFQVVKRVFRLTCYSHGSIAVSAINHAWLSSRCPANHVGFVHPPKIQVSVVSPNSMPSSASRRLLGRIRLRITEL